MKVAFGVLFQLLLMVPKLLGLYREICIANRVNSGKLLPDNAGDNPEPSLVIGRCNDYPEREYTQVSGSAWHPNCLRRRMMI